MVRRMTVRGGSDVDGVHKTVEELAELTLNRGLLGVNRDDLILWFKHHNYYRFLGYAKTFMRDPKYGDKNFIAGTRFDAITGLMESDSDLRSAILSLIFPVERILRTSYARIAYDELESKNDPHRDHAFYLDPHRYRRNDEWDDGEADRLVDDIIRDLSRSRDVNVTKFFNRSATVPDYRYANVPVWAAVEAMSFGRISRILELSLDQDVARGIAAEYSLQWDRFCSDVHAICDLRNRCAHHDQLWNRQCPSPARRIDRYTKYSHWRPCGGSAQMTIMTVYRFRKGMGLPDAERATIEQMLENDETFRNGILNPNWHPRQHA
ncbi:Abi family protein [Bifidobacterium sp. SO1]|uniref:Abi family protein n=1 Tax=Bifidobacterium sp. SO1 TaxID=2809029 RepID=UPI001BDD9870|nr:Abi family protein [Bifidobacterium sp. SO1]MBT1161799.1 Abi family protein [Bifidobacterium sp. SO1]